MSFKFVLFLNAFTICSAPRQAVWEELQARTLHRDQYYKVNIDYRGVQKSLVISEDRCEGYKDKRGNLAFACHNQSDVFATSKTVVSRCKMWAQCFLQSLSQNVRHTKGKALSVSCLVSLTTFWLLTKTENHQILVVFSNVKIHAQRCTKAPGARPPVRFNFVRWVVRMKTCLTSSLWRLEFWVGPWICGKSVHPFSWKSHKIKYSTTRTPECKSVR